MPKRLGVSAILVGSLLITSSTGLNADDRLKKDRRRMAVGAVTVAASPLVMGAGVVTFNPVIAGAGVAMFTAGSGLFGVGGGGYIVHKMQDRRAQEALANSRPTQFETLVPVPQRPGYYYDPSNPNQLYVDQNQATAPMQAKIDAPTVSTPSRVTIKIANAAKDGRSIECAVDGTRFSVPPGYTQTLDAAPGAVISYDSGNGTAIERYTLNEGSYEFQSVENTWKFYSQEPARSVASRSPTTNSTPAASVPR
jgi:hypothetical protein